MEATGWEIATDGKVVLTADRLNSEYSPGIVDRRYRPKVENQKEKRNSGYTIADFSALFTSDSTEFFCHDYRMFGFNFLNSPTVS
ncbi:MAG: hypothetical protein HC789_02660 [Microcoleus sp. CSU_2_2]|nr:hypothetical protein [Microcoleus sp. SU_5_3]NJS09347.1 hypothetical protein [Microcoleus sp. CSU_2_2]